MYLVIGILMLMLVVNWTYLVLASRHTSRLADMLAYSAVTELLDREWLKNHATHGSDSQTHPRDDNATAAKTAITDARKGFLKRNNEVAGPALRPSAANDGELTTVVARVPDASQFALGGNFIPMPDAPQFARSLSASLAGPSGPYNTLRVEIFRDPAGPNPVLFIMRGFGSPNAAKITGAATVTLDSRLVGFRPSGVFRAPVAPLAIDQCQFFDVRQAGNLDSNCNGIKELDFYLKPVGHCETSNAALVGLKAGCPLDTSGMAIEEQIREGERESDFAEGFLGPVAPQEGVPYAAGITLRLDASQKSNHGSISAAGLACAFDDVRMSSYPRRVFPVYSKYCDPLTIVGFVGARVISTDSDRGRLRVRLEPDFIVHATAETAPTACGDSVPENIYIHKTRLTR